MIFRRHAAVPFLLLLAIADDAFGLVILAVFYPTGRSAPADRRGADGRGSAHCVRTAPRRRALVLAVCVDRRFPVVECSALGRTASGARTGADRALLPRATRSTCSSIGELPVQLVALRLRAGNAGVPLIRYGPGTWAVAAGLIAGKPLGISIATALAVAAGLRLPDHFAWGDVVVVGFASGIGFTVALFFATALFPPGVLLDETKIGALASLASGAVAVMVAKVLRSGRFAAAIVIRRFCREERP